MISPIIFLVLYFSEAGEKELEEVKYHRTYKEVSSSFLHNYWFSNSIMSERTC